MSTTDGAPCLPPAGPLAAPLADLDFDANGVGRRAPRAFSRITAPPASSTILRTSCRSKNRGWRWWTSTDCTTTTTATICATSGVSGGYHVPAQPKKILKAHEGTDWRILKTKAELTYRYQPC